ncbi:MAG: hypothetical protein AB7O66_01275 [Limisphaerales bacterium]
MPPDRNALKELAEKIKDAAEQVSTAAQRAHRALDRGEDWGEVEKHAQAVAKAHREVSAAFADFSAQLGADPQTGATSTFADFLGEVGRAAIDTQERLDLANRAAVAAGVASGGLPMGVFQMPKLHGEIRFALEKTRSEKLGLVFYSHREEQQSRNEQSLAFDILSVPPPPELIQAVRDAQPALSLVLSRPQRNAVFATLKTVQEVLGKDDAPQSAALLEKHRDILQGDPVERDTVLIIPWRDPRRVAGTPGNPEDGFILVYAAPPSDGADWSVGVWQLELRPDAAPNPAPGNPSLSPPRLHILWRFDSKGTAAENILRFKEWVRSVGEKQRAFIS